MISSIWKECAEASRFLKLPPGARPIVFYAEGRRDFPFYEDLLEALLHSSKMSIAYITSESEDPILKSPPARIYPFYFKQLLPWIIRNLEAEVLLMTVPDLQRYGLRRSVRGAHHVYLFHALCSTHMIYRFGAFDHYDTVLCAGPHQAREIRAAEEKYRLTPKQMVEAGYPRLDHLIGNHPNSLPSSSKILIAPSWGPSNILQTCIEPLTQALVQDRFHVVIRPHPEAVRRDRHRIQQLSRRFSGLQTVSVETDPLQQQSIHEADVLVTDWSGIAFEYAFSTERPVLFIDTPPKINNPRYAELGIPPLEIRLRNVIGKSISPESCNGASGSIRELLRDRALYKEKILRAREESVFHLGKSAQVVARFLLDLARA